MAIMAERVAFLFRNMAILGSSLGPSTPYHVWGFRDFSCLGVKLGHPVPGGYKYEDLALQVGGVWNVKQ
jgi:hypothetical protein